MIYVRVPNQFRQDSDFGKLLNELQTYTEQGVEYIYGMNGRSVSVDTFIGKGWKIAYTRFDIRDVDDWYIKFEDESLASIFTLRWPQ